MRQSFFGDARLAISGGCLVTLGSELECADTRVSSFRVFTMKQQEVTNSDPCSNHHVHHLAKIL